MYFARWRSLWPTRESLFSSPLCPLTHLKCYNWPTTTPQRSEHAMLGSAFLSFFLLLLSFSLSSNQQQLSLGCDVANGSYSTQSSIGAGNFLHPSSSDPKRVGSGADQPQRVWGHWLHGQPHPCHLSPFGEKPEKGRENAVNSSSISTLVLSIFCFLPRFSSFLLSLMLLDRSPPRI